MSRRNTWVGLAVIAAITAVALVVGYWYVGDGQPEGSRVNVAGAQPMPRVGQRAPAAGDTPLADGQPTWLVFMATWCQDCRVEAPDVEAAAARGDVRVVGIFVGERARTVSDYAARVPLTFGTLADEDSSISAAFGVRSVPSHFFIDGSGVVREVAFGALSAGQIKGKLDALITSG